MTHPSPPLAADRQATLSLVEVNALLWALDDEDLLVLQPDEYRPILRAMWRRLHLWRLAKRGDTDAAAMLEHEFPETSHD